MMNPAKIPDVTNHARTATAQVYNNHTMPEPKLYFVPKEPRPPAQAPNNLPFEPTPLVGRDQDLEAACRMLAEADVRLLTLVGPGGVGKTRLALRVAEEMLEGFEDGVYFVELASIAEADLVIPTIANTLQVREEPGVPLVSTLITHLLGKRILLVLDNFEQVVSARAAMAELLAKCQDLKLLVTSRAALGLRTERAFEVSPLATPGAASLRGRGLDPAQLLQYGAIELFVQRAGTLQPGFELTGDNADAIVEICGRVDGLPLAIELVAAHARLLSPQSILARLTHPLRLLTGGPQDAPIRHRTMRDTIEWSYRLLDEEEQKLFRRLSVFVGGFSVRVAEAVCNETGDIGVEVDDPKALEVLEGLEALVDKNLVRSLEQAEDGNRRLAMLETVRGYALERLQESGEGETLARRHAEYFLALAEEAAPYLTGPDQRRWVTRLDAEHNNLRAVLSRCLPGAGQSAPPGGQPDPDPQAAWMALRLAGALSEFWAQDSLGEGRRWLQAALEAAGHLNEAGDSLHVESRALSKARVKALNGAGMLARLAADFPAAKQALQTGLEVSRKLGDRREVSRTLVNLGSMAIVHGDFAGARRYLRESLAIRRNLGLELEAAYSLTHLGNVAMLEERYTEARRLHEQGLAIKRKAGDKQGIGHSLHSLATIARRQGKLNEARRLDEETLAIAHELGNKPGIAYSLRDLGNVAYEQADYSMALSSFLESLALFQELEDVLPIIDCLMGLARVAAHTGQPGRAVRLFGTAYAMLETTEGQLEPADSVASERDLASLRARLSEEAFTRAWEEGRAMTLEQALQLATQEPPTQSAPGARGRPRKRSTGGLTTREYDVATLVTQGLSNEEIALRLVLSERTVETYVSNALHKLGLTTRTQLAAWAVEQGLTRGHAGS
jgi:predicted ATPase/DNA-binding CsgD family transcriptional regulator